MKRYLELLIVLSIISGIVYLAFLLPQNDRLWEDYHAKTPSAHIGSHSVTLSNVRDWTYQQGDPVSTLWLDGVEIYPEDIEAVWFGLSRFSDWGALGHTFLSFELADGSAYVLSIEARREKGEEYTAFKGLFRKYDLLYGWGTERDYIGVRVDVLEQPIEFYRLALSPEEAAGIFKAAALATNKLEHTPRFYNTLFSNCTNELVQAINDQYPDSMGYHIAQNLPGLSVEYLMDLELIDSPVPSVIPIKDEALMAAALESNVAYSHALRDTLER